MGDNFGYLVKEVKRLGVNTSDDNNLREENYRLTIQTGESLPTHIQKPKDGQVLTFDTVVNDEENRYLAKRRTGTIPFYYKDTNLLLYGEEEKNGKDGHQNTWHLYLKLGEEVKEDDKGEKEVSTRTRQQQRHQEDNGNGNSNGELVFVSVNGRKMQEKDCAEHRGSPCPTTSNCWKECNDSFGLHKTDKSAVTLLEGSSPMVLFGCKWCVFFRQHFPIFTAVVTIRRWSGTGPVSELPLQFQQLLSERKCFQEQREMEKGFANWREDKDVKMECSDGVTVEAHREILMVRSSVFAAMLGMPKGKDNQRPSFAEGDGNKIKIEDVSSAAMNAILEFIYTGSLSEGWKKCPQEVVWAADKYGLEELLGILDSILPNVCTPKNALELGRLAELHRLKNARVEIEKYISKHLRQIYREQTAPKRSSGSGQEEGDAKKKKKKEAGSDREEDHHHHQVPDEDIVIMDTDSDSD